MHSNQILALIQADKFYLVKVRFKHNSQSQGITYSDKTYTYKVPKFVKLELEDEVIVDSPFNGFVVVKVVDIIDGGVLYDQDFTNSKGYKWIVQKVCADQYYKHLEREYEAEQVLKQHLTNKARKEAIASINEMFGEDLLTNLNEVLAIR